MATLKTVSTIAWNGCHPHSMNKLQWSLGAFPELLVRLRGGARRWSCPEVTYRSIAFNCRYIYELYELKPKPLSGTRSDRKSCCNVGLTRVERQCHVLFGSSLSVCVSFLPWLAEQLHLRYFLSCFLLFYYFLVTLQNPHFRYRHSYVFPRATMSICLQTTELFNTKFLSTGVQIFMCLLHFVHCRHAKFQCE